MAALGKLVDEHTQQEAHEHLLRECPWYGAVHRGEAATEPHNHCIPHDEELPRLVVKLTPHTAEASTVPKPTVPPGGPGLFHVKGLELPPYIQHLWYHLVKEYGRHKAYGVAVGIVHKWAKGINPGGFKTKSGKGKRTHPDVRAAAQRTIAQWNEDRAKAHQQSASHAHATASLAAKADEYTFPGSEEHPVTPVPDEGSSKSMFTAHRIDEMVSQLSHGKERLGAARKAKNDKDRNYHMLHVANHLAATMQNAHQLAGNFTKNYPAEGRELADMTEVMNLARALSPAAKAATTAHLLQSVAYDGTHAKRHADAMVARPGTRAEWDFNADHAEKHLKSALVHALKLAHHIHDNYPAESRWLRALEHAEGPEATHGQSRKSAVAQLAGPRVTAPGAAPAVLPPTPGGRYSQYGLWQKPSQTVSPSPPLPPKSPLPTPDECLRLARQVPDSEDITLSNTARLFLEQAAGKLQKGANLEALAVLRSALTALAAAHRADIAVTMPSQYTANVFARTPPAEQSSAAAVLTTRDRARRWRSLEQGTQQLADRIRRRFFHGLYNGPSQMARLSEESEMSAVDRVLALASGPPAVHDVSEPTESDTSGATPLLQVPETLGGIMDADARAKFDALPPIDKLRISRYMDAARACVATSPTMASQHLARAKAIAAESGAHDLCRHLHQAIEALTLGIHRTPTAAEAEAMPKGARNSPDKSSDPNTRLSASLR